MILNIRDSADTLRQADCRANVFHVVPSFPSAPTSRPISDLEALKSWLLVAGETAADKPMPRPCGVRRKSSAPRSSRRGPTPSSPARAGPNPATSRCRPRCADGHPGRSRPRGGRGGRRVRSVRRLSPLPDRPAPSGRRHPRPRRCRLASRVRAVRRIVAAEFLRAPRKRWMRERDYDGWLAAKIFGEAGDARRIGPTRGGPRLHHRADFKIGGHKGIGLTFRPWDNQMRQPILVMGPGRWCRSRRRRASCTSAPNSTRSDTTCQTAPAAFPDSPHTMEIAHMKALIMPLAVATGLATAVDAEAGRSSSRTKGQHRHGAGSRQPGGAEDDQDRKRPRGIVLGADGTEVFVCAGDDDRIDVIDTAHAGGGAHAGVRTRPRTARRRPRGARGSTSPTRTTR